MNLFFWLIVWVLMATAFTTAWVFIVRGCEALDEAQGEPLGGRDQHSH